jgi:hypothetical protein
MSPTRHRRHARHCILAEVISDAIRMASVDEVAWQEGRNSACRPCVVPVAPRRTVMAIVKRLPVPEPMSGPLMQERRDVRAVRGRIG